MREKEVGQSCDGKNGLVPREGKMPRGEGGQ